MEEKSDKREIGERIEEAMFARGLNQARLAELIGISRGAVSMLVNGKRFPSREILRKLANELSVSVDYLVGEATDAAELENLLQNDKIRTLVAKFSRLNIRDQERVLDMLNLLEKTGPE